jgi:hypothetical protein
MKPPGRVAILAVVFLCLISLNGCRKFRAKKAIVYVPTQETVEQFGDGRFELATTTQGTVLRDIKAHRTLLSHVVGWLEENGRVYAKNKDGVYVVLDPDADTWESYSTLNDMPEDDHAAASRIVHRSTFAPHGGL